MAETLIPLEEREEERRPSRVEPPRRSGGWVGKLALVLAVFALAVACLALYRTLPPGEDDPQEPGERAESPTISYRDRELPVLEGVAVNSYVSDGFSVNDRGWLTYEQDGKQAAIGIDVSAYQGEIDWQQVADSGVEFAMIRLGYRGSVSYTHLDVYKRQAFDIAEEADGVRLSCGLLLPGQDLKRHLRGCGRAAVFCATLSAQVDALIRRWESGDMLRALALDCSAAAAVEQMCDQIELELQGHFPGCSFPCLLYTSWELLQPGTEYLVTYEWDDRMPQEGTLCMVHP